MVGPKPFQVRAKSDPAVTIKRCERPVGRPVVGAVEIDNVTWRKRVVEGIEPLGEGQVPGPRHEPFAHDSLVAPQEGRGDVRGWWYVLCHGLEQPADESSRGPVGHDDAATGPANSEQLGR